MHSLFYCLYFIKLKQIDSFALINAGYLPIYIHKTTIDMTFVY